MSELTARINDEGWDSCFSNWLKVSNLNKKIVYLYYLLVVEISKKVSMNIVES